VHCGRILPALDRFQPLRSFDINSLTGQLRVKALIEERPGAQLARVAALCSGDNRPGDTHAH
jgi:hypothetical protein